MERLVGAPFIGLMALAGGMVIYFIGFQRGRADAWSDYRERVRALQAQIDRISVKPTRY